MIETLKKASFDPHLNEKFEIHTESVGKVEVELVEIAEKEYENMETFSVMFKGPKDKPFEQDVHGIKHPKMGEFGLFLVPVISEKEDGAYYQAVFNRVIEPEDD